jgi:hypothetical protein
MKTIDTVANSMMPDKVAAMCEARSLLLEWLNYYDSGGHSFGLKKRTESVIARLPEPPRYTPTPEEVRRMENDGEP